MAEKTKNGFGNVIKVTAGLVVGAAAGFAAGVLFAPKTGKETREEVKDASLKFKEEANNYTEDLKQRGEEIFKRGTDTLKIGKKKVNDDLIEIANDIEGAAEKSPVEQVVAKVKKIGKNSKDTAEDVIKAVAQEAKEEKNEIKNDYAADSLLARIQGITADTLED